MDEIINKCFHNIELAPDDRETIKECMREYARLKVKQQRDLMATFLAQNFNMRNIERPKF